MAEETVGETVGKPVGEPTEGPTQGPKEKWRHKGDRRSQGEPTEGPTEGPKEPWYCKEHGAVTPRVSSGRMFCPVCNKLLRREPYQKEKETKEEEKERREEERGPLPPLEVSLVERVKELLVKELPRVYGIPKKQMNKTITAIIDTLTPAAAMDEWNLHSHIKDFAENANDRHLESVIKKIFYDLEEEGYMPKEQEHRPRYGDRDRRRESRRPHRPSYAPRSRTSRRYYDYEDYPPYDYEEDYEDYPPRRRRGNPGMTVVLDGQEIRTDFQGYMAYQRFKKEAAEEKRRDQEHELMMKRLEAEIKKITAETGGSKKEPLVKVKVGEEEMDVPVSIAPLYLRREKEPLVKVKVGEDEMEVPASVAPFYLRRDDKELKDLEGKLEKEREERLKEREERHKAEMKRLEEKIDKKEPLVKVKVGEEELEVPASIAPLYFKRDDSELKGLRKDLEEEKEKRHQAEMKRIEEKIDEFEKRPGFLEQLEYYEKTGHKIGLERGGRTTMDVLDSFRGDLQTTAQQILNKIPSGGQPFRPEVTRTPEERRKAAEEIKRRLRKSEDILAAEDELIKAASKVTTS